METDWDRIPSSYSSEREGISLPVREGQIEGGWVRHSFPPPQVNLPHSRKTAKLKLPFHVRNLHSEVDDLPSSTREAITVHDCQ